MINLINILLVIFVVCVLWSLQMLYKNLYQENSEANLKLFRHNLKLSLENCELRLENSKIKYKIQHKIAKCERKAKRTKSNFHRELYKITALKLKDVIKE